MHFENKKNIIFYGTPEFAAIQLKSLINSNKYNIRAVITQPDKAAGRGKQLSESAVKKIALEHSLLVLQPDNINRIQAQFLDSLKALGKIDIAVVVAFGQILPVQVLEYPENGSVNIHASLLPRWRGAAPIQRAIMAGDKETGICLMKMEAGLDSGPVYSRYSIAVKDAIDAGQLHDQLAELAASALITDLDKIMNNELQAIPQSEAGVLYAKKISNQECQIDWLQSALEIQRKILALSPWPGAYCEYNQQRLKIFSALAVTARSGLSGGSPGEVYFQDAKTLEVQTGDGIISIKELQLAGKKRLNIAEFLRGIEINRLT